MHSATGVGSMAEEVLEQVGPCFELMLVVVMTVAYSSAAW